MKQDLNSVYVIILAWNHLQDTMECLNSVLATTYPETRVAVVDNASTDGTIETIKNRYPSVIRIENQQNLGYAEGNNVGIRYALEQKADFIFILNNDTVIEPDTISLLVNDLLENPNSTAASPKSYFYDKPDTVYFAGGILTEWGQAKHVIDETGPEPGGYVTEWLNGCALMMRSKDLATIGLFEPRFFLMHEDVDWSLRAKRCGYDLRVVPSSKIRHKASTSFGGPRSPMQIYYHIRNQHLCFERNYPLKQRIIFHKNRMRRDFKSLKKTIKILTAYSPVDKAIRQAYLDYCFRRFFARDYHWQSA